jgi:hypothetical protein
MALDQRERLFFPVHCQEVSVKKLQNRHVHFPGQGKTTGVI